MSSSLTWQGLNHRGRDQNHQAPSQTDPEALSLISVDTTPCSSLSIKTFLKNIDASLFILIFSLKLWKYRQQAVAFWCAVRLGSQWKQRRETVIKDKPVLHLSGLSSERDLFMFCMINYSYIISWVVTFRLHDWFFLNIWYLWRHYSPCPKVNSSFYNHFPILRWGSLSLALLHLLISCTPTQ